MEKYNAIQNNCFFKADYRSCSLCPRECLCDRGGGKTGVCGVSGTLKVARAALHYWEEPCISGNKGSGAVFFSGCSLHCVFCQNEEIARGTVGKEITVGRLAEIFLELEDKGANNINLVTPGQYLPHIIGAVERAKDQGLNLPIIYNTSGYEKVEQLKRLEGIVDVYLPDFKYFSEEPARKYSHAKDYPAIVKAAIKEMVRQQPKPLFYKEEEKDQWKLQIEQMKYKEAEEDLLIGKGVIVRQLLLPGMLEDAKKIVRYLHQTYGKQIYLSLMSQYTPLPHVKEFRELDRKIKKQEYEEYMDYAIDIGVEYGFIQEGDVAKDSFIPDFNGEGV